MQGSTSVWQDHLCSPTCPATGLALRILSAPHSLQPLLLGESGSEEAHLVPSSLLCSQPRITCLPCPLLPWLPASIPSQATQVSIRTPPHPGVLPPTPLPALPPYLPCLSGLHSWDDSGRPRVAAVHRCRSLSLLPFPTSSQGLLSLLFGNHSSKHILFLFAGNLIKSFRTVSSS